MRNNVDCLDATLALLKGMDSTVLGLQQLRGYVVGVSDKRFWETSFKKPK